MPITAIDDRDVFLATVTIPASGSLSEALALRGMALVHIQMPGAWDAAALTFSTSADGTTYGSLKKGGTEYSITVAASDAQIIPRDDFAGVRFLKVRSGTAGTPVNQTAARTITLVLRKL